MPDPTPDAVKLDKVVIRAEQQRRRRNGGIDAWYLCNAGAEVLAEGRTFNDNLEVGTQKIVTPNMLAQSLTNALDSAGAA